MSDHGFASWRRSFNLNTWLRDNGTDAPAGPRIDGMAPPFRRHRLVGHARLRTGTERPLHQPPGTRVVWYRRSGRRDALVREIAGNCCRRSTRAPARRRSRASSVARMSTGCRGTGARTGHHRRLREGHAARTTPRSAAFAGRAHGQPQRVDRRPLHGSGGCAGHSADQPATATEGGEPQGAGAGHPGGARHRGVSVNGEEHRHVRIGHQARQGTAGQGQAVLGSGRLFVPEEFITHALEKEIASSRLRTAKTRSRSD